ncbi:MAG: hypothetical protein K2P94_01375, partial [Rhodospirillaceae bacterium]|nr:hypothetical protein [Rhodospirillaceae bacterium]
MFSAFFKAFGQLTDPPLMRIVLRAVAAAAVLVIVLVVLPLFRLVAPSRGLLAFQARRALALESRGLPGRTAAVVAPLEGAA